MLEHVHLLLSEPERSTLAVVLQMLKQVVSQKLKEHATNPSRQPRYYDFNVYREQKLMEKLDYMHRNPVQRGLVTCAEDWRGAVPGTMLPEQNAGWRLSLIGQPIVVSSLAFYPAVRRRDVS